MSDFRGGGPTFDLTPTKAKYWHRNRTRRCCVSLVQIGETHLSPAGFVWHVGKDGNFLRLTAGPGLVAHDDSPLFEAVSGRKSWR